MNPRFPRILVLSAGGIAIAIMLAWRACLYKHFGYLPNHYRWLGIDFASNPPTAADFPRDISHEARHAVGLKSSEISVLSFGGAHQQLAERIKAGDPNVNYLGDLIDPELLGPYSGAEGAQIPAIVRAALAYCAGARDSWCSLIDRNLHELSSIANDGPDAVTAIFVGGGQGGTGTGALFPLAVATRWMAQSKGMRLDAHAFVLAGHYREKDGQEENKAGLNYALDRDLERAVEPGNTLAFPLGAKRTALFEGRLFDTVLRQEVWGAFEHDEGSAIARAARTLAFRYAAPAAFELQNSRGNVENKGRLLPLLERSRRSI